MIECLRARMHGRTQIISFQAKQQLTNLRIGFGPISPTSGSKFLEAHGFKPQSSSLIKIPLYLTEGALDEKVFTFKHKDFFLTTGASAHQYRGDTPYGFRDREQSISCSTAVGTGYYQCFLFPGKDYQLNQSHIVPSHHEFY